MAEQVYTAEKTGEREIVADYGRTSCGGCGSTHKTLMAPFPNARNYTGPMFCVSCNPRHQELPRVDFVQVL